MAYATGGPFEGGVALDVWQVSLIPRFLLFSFGFLCFFVLGEVLGGLLGWWTGDGDEDGNEEVLAFGG